jgi:N-methylhydantoinase A
VTLGGRPDLGQPPVDLVRKVSTRTGARRGNALSIGIDTGGTFTDIVFRVGARVGVHKSMSTPDDPSRAVLAAIASLFPDTAAERITYGTTVATNAMLERRGARTALLTTHGFEDVLEIGRQARPDLYALEPQKIEPLVATPMRVGVHERTLYDGSIEQRLSAAEAHRLRRRVERMGVEAIAIVFLHGHVNPAHERRLARALRSLRLPITLSSEISPLPGEYERASTTVANAYVRPVVEHHLRSLRRRARTRALHVMQSNGGAIDADIACAEPIRTMLSGPAGGVSAAAACAAGAGFPRVITLDMGGTSTDVALVDSAPLRRMTTDVGGIPIRTPSLDIHTVGAGGGSIAHVDAGGALRVGPQSAGAHPGPACYGLGSQPTVTDANLVLGRLRPEAFLGGGMTLDTQRALGALRNLATRMRASSVIVAADGVIRVVENNMERAIRVITVERGQDPRTCVLVPFGGAAGLHACGLADELGITSILIPPDPGLLSAWGMLNAPLVRDVTRPLRVINPTFTALAPILARASAQASRCLVDTGAPARRVRVTSFVTLRYLGEGSTLEIEFDRDFVRRFRREHAKLFHRRQSEAPIESTSIRATATANPLRLERPRNPRAASRAAAAGRKVTLWIDGKRRSVPTVERSALAELGRLRGPALITEYSSTCFVRPGWTLRTDSSGNLRLEQ